MIASFLRSSIAGLIVMCAGLPALSQTITTDDPLAEFLHSRGFANIPYIKQNQAKLGGVVADPFSPGLATFEVPSKAVPSADPNPGILIPAEIVSKIQSAGLGLKFLGFDSAADFQHPETLTYSTINLTGPQLNIDQVRDLLKDSATVKKLDYYKGDLTRFKKYQKFTADLYIVSGVFYTTGVDIVAKTGTTVSLKSNVEVPACAATPVAGSPKGSEGKDTNSPDTVAAPAKQPTAPTDDAKTKDPKAVAPVAKGAASDADAPVKKVASATNAASEAVVKAADTVSSAVDKGIPGGQGHYCRGINGEVHFSSDRPIPVALEVYSPVWNGTGYEARSPSEIPIFKIK